MRGEVDGERPTSERKASRLGKLPRSEYLRSIRKDFFERKGES
jgi:hypothetical protein